MKGPPKEITLYVENMMANVFRATQKKNGYHNTLNFSKRGRGNLQGSTEN